MERTYIEDAGKNIGKEILLKGFVHEMRDQSKIKFLLLRDKTGILQCITFAKDEFFKDIGKISKESVLELTGEAVESKQAPNGVELKVKSYKVLSEAASPLPIEISGKAEASMPVRLDHRWLDLRNPKKLLIFKIWTSMERAMRDWWKEQGFLQIYSPKFMGAASESGAELFEVEYFGKKAYLAQSPQFYKQMAMASGFEKIFEIGPVFRANKSHTRRHDTEFTMIDMELSFIESHEDVMKAEESWIAYFISKIKEEYGNEIKEVFGVDIVVPTTPFPRIPMDEAQKLLAEKGYKGPKDDFDAEGEKMFSDLVKEKYGHEFVFVTEYPWSIRPFYHMRSESGETNSFDLIWKGTEITTGAQREHRHNILREQAIEKGLDPGSDGMKDYMSFFKYGCPPHGGFGLSPTRVLMLLLDIANVREVTFLPRDTTRLTP
jgi:nondiscriminating aspartyl-tRNA synthetase